MVRLDWGGSVFRTLNKASFAAGKRGEFTHSGFPESLHIGVAAVHVGCKVAEVLAVFAGRVDAEVAELLFDERSDVGRLCGLAAGGDFAGKIELALA